MCHHGSSDSVYPNSKTRVFTLMIIFVMILHFIFLITYLDVVFVKTYAYTCTTDEPHLIIMCLYFIAQLYPLDVLV